MSFGLQECCVPCSTPETVNIQGLAGEDGDPGLDGADGQSAFTVTTLSFLVPPTSNNVTIAVANTGFMAVGQPLFIPGAGFLIVEAIISAIAVELSYPNWDSNTHTGEVIDPGTPVVCAGWQPVAPSLPAVDNISKYGSGTAHTITGASFAAVTFGTSGAQQITITAAGTWLLTARARVDFVAATFAAVRTVSFKLRRTNNTAGDVANAATAFKTPLSASALTYTALDAVLPGVQYVTANVDDVIQLQTAIDTDPGAGSVQIVEADLVAIYLHA